MVPICNGQASQTVIVQAEGKLSLIYFPLLHWLARQTLKIFTFLSYKSIKDLI